MPSPRTRRLDRALPVAKPGIWIATIVIILGGAFVFFVLGQPDRMRRRALAGVEVGQSAESATAAIGRAPAVCPVTALDHLRTSFPDGWSPAAIDVALERLELETGERWVYPLEVRETASCTTDAQRTEAGVSADGTLLWFVAVLGSSPLSLPAGFTPAGFDTTAVH